MGIFLGFIFFGSLVQLIALALGGNRMDQRRWK